MNGGTEKRRSALNFETVASISAMVIGACALYVTWDQSQVMRKQQHASVWPLLAPDFSIDQQDDHFIIELSLDNKGVGPALVESAYLTVNGERASDQAVLMLALFGDLRPTGSANLIGSSVENTAIGAGDAVRVFRVAWPMSDQNALAFQTLANRYIAGDGPNVSMTTCYCSVFDRCFISNGRDRLEQVKQCPEPTNFFSTMLQASQGRDK